MKLAKALPVLVSLVACGDMRQAEEDRAAAPVASAPTAPTGAPPEADQPAESLSTGAPVQKQRMADSVAAPPPAAAPGNSDSNEMTGSPSAKAGAVELAAIAPGEDAGRSREEIAKAVSDQTPSLQACLSKGDVRVRMEAQVDASGALSDVKVAKAEPSDQAVNDCLAQNFRKVILPRATTGKSDKIAVELMLRRAVSY